jgi:hypothetical protein
MSFKEITSDVSIANRALGMVAESKMISSLEDPGHIAQVIRRWYKPTVARLLETHHWGLATKRIALLQITNDRPNEWLYSFAAPDDVAFPVGIVQANGTGNVSYYHGLAGLIGMLYGKPIFQFHNNVFYSNLEGDLEYVSFDITEAAFNETFTNIVILRLAAKCALEIPKDAELAQELENSAATEINIAITHNLNAGGQKYGNAPSEAELVRGSLYGSNWDYFPGRLP